MLIIKVDNQNIEKRKTFATKQLKELREREEYVKPSVTKRSEKSKAKYRQSFQEE
jgi:ribosomal protein S21